MDKIANALINNIATKARKTNEQRNRQAEAFNKWIDDLVAKRTNSRSVSLEQRNEISDRLQKMLHFSEEHSGNG